MKTRVAEAVLGCLILWLTGEILVRRWVFAQIPTPIGAWPTYALIAFNLVVLILIARRLKGWWASSRRTGRS